MFRGRTDVVSDGEAVSDMALLEVLGHISLRLTVDVNRAMADAGGLSLARYRILRFVEAMTPTGALAIRQYFDFAARTVTEALDGLERDGLLARTRDIHDRRRIAIAITDAGRRMLRVSEAPLLDAAGRAFKPLTAAEKATLAALLHRVTEPCDAA